MFHALLTVAVVVVLADEPDVRVQKELEKLQGDWTATAMFTNYKPRDPEGRKVTIRGNRWTQTSNQKTAAGDAVGPWESVIEINPRKEPKTLDLLTQVDGKETRMPSIYRLNGDELTICRGSMYRYPKNFSNDGKFVFKRVKVAQQPKP